MSLPVCDPCLDVGCRIRAVRKRKGMPMRVLGERIGLTHPQILHLENGQRHATMCLVDHIAQALEVDAAELLGLPNRHAVSDLRSRIVTRLIELAKEFVLEQPS